MKKIIWLILIVILLYWGYTNWLKPDPAPVLNLPVDSSADIEWRTYTNNSYANFSLQYPSDWEIKNDTNQTQLLSPDGKDAVVVYLQRVPHTGGDDTQTTTTVNGHPALVIQSSIGTIPIKYTIFTLENGEKLEISGYGRIYDEMVSTLVIDSDQPANESENSEENLEENDEVSTDDSTVAEDNEEELSPDNSGNQNPPPAKISGPEDIRLFFSKSGENECNIVYGLNKPIDDRYGTDEINALIALLGGLTAEERTAGYFTSLPDGTRLRKLTITSDGVATADFNAPLNSGGGSCSMAARRAQITQTLLQFPDVNTVIITVDGDEETALQP
ncbi:MAG: GerMN domain-containing protein [Candidatus Komeilibacteria bacterium]|nr:GerMN domain-containing protein [Candidatus Komeilibacteria bacterium]